VGSGMFADRTLVRDFLSPEDIAAVSAVPLHGSLLFKDLSFLRILQKTPISLLMKLFNLGHPGKGL